MGVGGDLNLIYSIFILVYLEYGCTSKTSYLGCLKCNQAGGGGKFTDVNTTPV